MKRTGAFLAAASAIAACATAPPLSGDLSLTAKTPSPGAAPTRSVALAPAVLKTFSQDGSASAQVEVRLDDLSPPGAGALRLLALPSTWSTGSAAITLWSPTASAAFDAAKHKQTLSFALIPASNPPRYRATGAFAALRPAADYRAELVLTNSAGKVVTARLAASSGQDLVLSAGTNTIVFEATVNGQEALYEYAAGTTSLAGAASFSWAGATLETFAGTGAGAGGSPTNGPRLSATFEGPNGVLAAPDGCVYVGEMGSPRLRKIAPNGEVTTLAGNGSAGFADATGAAARFQFPAGMAYVAASPEPYLLLADAGNNRIRKVTTVGGAVSTVAGSGAATSVDGAGTAASFNMPFNLVADGAGGYLVADYAGNRIRRMTGAYAVTTYAGTGVLGGTDGPALSATFDTPVGLTLTASGGLIVGDHEGGRVRLVDPYGRVSTLAGTSVVGGPYPNLIDGAGAAAKFGRVYGIAPDGNGNFLVADWDNGAIRHLTSAGVVSTVLSGLSGPNMMSLGPDGCLYVAGRMANKIWRLLPRTGYLTAGDQVQIKTGLQAGQPVVDHLDVKLSGSCYGNPGSPVLVKRFTGADAASWDTWGWDTTAANAANGANYVPATLTGGASYNDGQLDFEAYDRYGVLVGKASLGIRVFKAASVTTVHIN